MSLPDTGEHDRRLDESLLRSLHVLLSEASVSQAAARLGVAQSALSRHLRCCASSPATSCWCAWATAWC